MFAPVGRRFKVDIVIVTVYGFIRIGFAAVIGGRRTVPCVESGCRRIADIDGRITEGIVVIIVFPAVFFTALKWCDGRTVGIR